MVKKRHLLKKKDLKKLYWEKNLNTLKIGRIFNCAQRTIQIRMRELNIPLRPQYNKLTIPKKELFQLYIKQRLSSRKIAKIYNCAYSTIDSKKRKFGFPIRTLANAHITTDRKPFSGNKIEKAYLLGLAFGDLRVRKIYQNSETIHIDCGSTKMDQIRLIEPLFKKYGRVWISKPNKENKIQIECSVDLSFKFLLENNKGKMPQWILEKKEFFAAFLAGFTDAEGSIFISNGMASYALANYNHHLLNQIYHHLNRLNIDLKPPKVGRKKGAQFINKGKMYKTNGNYWVLSVNKKSSLIKLFNLIKPYIKHAKRENDIKRALLNIKERNIKFGNLNMN